MSMPSRKLAAILAADVVGYTRLIAEDETRTLDALRALRRELFEPLIRERSGKVVKRMGDGWLVSFASVEDAAQCAIQIQERLAGHDRIKLRIGIHLGDIVHEEEDIYGDGVNIAARLQESAAPGSVIVSGTAYESLVGRLDSKFTDGGEQYLKNVKRPVRAWIWSADALDGPRVTASEDSEALPLPTKPSIVVLPFKNLSGDAEQNFFADGITEDIITAISRFRSLFVISRSSSFTYQDRAIDRSGIATELGVRYIVEGSVRKAGNRVRISAQLIDAASNNHLWAERFDGALDDVFELQDQITEQIVTVVAPTIDAHERRRAMRKPPDSLDAWEHMQRGLSLFYRLNAANCAESIRILQEATELDPEFSVAYGHLAFALSYSISAGYAEDVQEASARAVAAAKSAISLDPTDPFARYALARENVHLGDVEMGIDEMQTVVASNPNLAVGQLGLAWAYHYGAGEPEQALSFYDAALRLSPRDPLRWAMLMLKGSALRFLGRHEEAIAHCRQACQLPDPGFQAYMHLGACLAEAGKTTEAQSPIQRAIQLQPALSLGFIRSRFVNMHETMLASLLDSLKKAGLSD